MKKIFLVTILLITSLLLTACGTKYRVTFMDGTTIYDQFSVKENAYLISPPEPLSEEYDFKGWFKDINDENSKWNFKNDLVVSHTLLHAKWELKKESIKITNYIIEDSILSWDLTDLTTYIIEYLDISETLNNPTYDFKDVKHLFSNETKITITPIKEDYISVVSELTLKFNESSTDEQLVLSFDEFPNSNYASNTIEYNDFNILMDNSLIGSLANDKKNGTKAARLQDNGIIEILEPFNNFESLTFDLAYYGTHNKQQTLSVYYKTLETDEYSLAKEFIVSFETLETITITKDELTLIDNFVYFKFVKDSKSSANVNIDDITIYEFKEESYNFKFLNELPNEDEELILSTYYKSAEGLTGKALVDELRIIINTNITLVSYGDARYVLEKSDLNPENNQEVIGIYDNDSIANYWIGKGEGAWQREHVWPNSKLGIKRVNNSSKNQGSDLHNLRAITGINQTRSNRYFDNDPNNSSDPVTIGANAFYPSDDHRGDTARILLYMAVKYDFLTLTDHLPDLINNTVTNYELSGAYMGKLSLLKNWHELDKVDNFEKTRNNVIYDSQKNRNPFIDHPSLFTSVFNYLVELDENRVKLTVSFEMFINFKEFKENKNYF